MKFMWNYFIITVITGLIIGFIGLTTMLIAGGNIDRELVSILWMISNIVGIIVGFIESGSYSDYIGADALESLVKKITKG